MSPISAETQVLIVLAITAAVWIGALYTLWRMTRRTRRSWPWL